MRLRVKPMKLDACRYGTVLLGLWSLTFALLGAGAAHAAAPVSSKPLPAFSLPVLNDGSKTFKSTDLLGQVWLLNAWASWCVACRHEHPVLLALAEKHLVVLVGLQHQDQPEAGVKWLTRHGNPYHVTLSDADGRVGIDLGIVGLPATLVIDRQGRVRERLLGPVTTEWITNKLLPLLKA